MAGFEILGFNAVEATVLVYFLIGSYSLGYLLLRTGWPKIRILDENYRIGWSSIFGIVFSMLWVSTAFALEMQDFFPIVLTITLVLTLIILSIRRVFFASKSITVAISKDKAAEQIVSEKSMQQLLSDRQFILNKSISEEQAEKIRQALGKVEG